MRKTAVIKNRFYGWPQVGSAATEFTITLPIRAVIVGFDIYKKKDPFGSGYTMSIGSNDKSATWATSSANSKGFVVHTDLAPSDWIEVDGDPNLRTVRLWATSNGTNESPNPKIGEFALIHYI